MGPASIMASLHNNISPKNAFPVSWEDVTCTDVENVVVYWEADVGRKGRRPQFIGFLRHSIHSLSRFPPPCALLTISSRQGQSHLIDLKFLRFFLQRALSMRFCPIITRREHKRAIFSLTAGSSPEKNF